MDQAARHLSEGSDYGSLPGEHVTIDQVVALNIRYWRKAAGMTQQELGEKIGWSAANVSDAERSGQKAQRRFDAQAIVTFAHALGVPVTALFFPPADDGIEKRYTFRAEPDMTSEMHQLAWLAISDPSEEDTPAMDTYRRRYVEVFRDYLGEDRTAQAAAAVPTTREAVTGELAALRRQHEALREILASNDRLQQALAERLLKEDRA